MRFGLHRNQNYGVLFEESKQIDAWLAEALSQICLSRHKTRHRQGQRPYFQICRIVHCGYIHWRNENRNNRRKLDSLFYIARLSNWSQAFSKCRL